MNVIDLTLLRELRVMVTNDASAWRVALPLQPWKFSKAEQERQAVVQKLRLAFPHMVLRISDWASDEWSGWRLLSSDESLSTWEDELENGAWALFFFEQKPSAILNDLMPVEPTDATDAVNVVRNLGAAAAIWSWYDDNEWLVVLL